MSQYTASDVRLRVGSIAAAVNRGTLQMIDFSERCVDAIGDTELATLPTAVELSAAAHQLDGEAFALSDLPPTLAALAATYGPVAENTAGEISATGMAAAARSLAADQRDLVHGFFVDALTEMGLVVEAHTDGAATMLYAADAEQVVAVEVGLDGGVEIDHAGCVDDACLPLQAELLRRLAERGVIIDLERSNVNLHGDPNGGALFPPLA